MGVSIIHNEWILSQFNLFASFQFFLYDTELFGI